jgi:hypothetical protein
MLNGNVDLVITNHKRYKIIVIFSKRSIKSGEGAKEL